MKIDLQNAKSIAALYTTAEDSDMKEWALKKYQEFVTQLGYDPLA